MRPIQWHLKNNWRVPKSLETVIQIPRSLHPHLQWWLKEDNILTGQPLHPIKHALQIFTDSSKEGWGDHLNEHTAWRTWSLPKKQAAYNINYVELKGVFSSLKRITGPLCRQDSSCSTRQHHSGVIHKQGRRHEVGPFCALLWSILTWCTRKQVALKARHFPGRLNVVADKLSMLAQTIQSGLSFQRSSNHYAAGGTSPR